MPKERNMTGINGIKKFFDKKVNIILSTVLAAVLILGIVLMCIYLPTYKGTPSSDYWKPSDAFTIEDTVILSKELGTQFKILNFADIQINSPLDLNKNTITYKTMKKTVDEVKPDLITLSGDNAWGRLTKSCVKKLIGVMESFGVPWAPVYGNHDREGNADLNWLGEMYAEAEHCLFRKGPVNIGGVGNYVINITENDKIVHSLIMIDSHSKRDYSSMMASDYTYYDNKGKIEKLGFGYDFIALSQIEWYKWVIKGIKDYNGGVTVPSSAIFHIPLMEYQFAYSAYKETGFDASIGSGEQRESVGCGMYNSGMFDAILEMDSTKNVLVGHDHVNDFSVIYQGVRLTYGVKTGDECYWVKDRSVNGGTVLTLETDNTMTVSQHYVNVGK